MCEYNSFFLLDNDSVKDYLIYKGFFYETDKLEIKEVGDGNINYVFIIQSDKKSLVVKQADKYLRASGRALDVYRSKIEYNILKTQHKLAPKYIPNVYLYDANMNIIVMEDISDYKNLRYELMQGKTFLDFSEEISTFLSLSLLPTTDLVMEKMEKKDEVKKYINKELCEISEDLVLTEPYWNYKNRNRITSGNEKFVEDNLYSNSKLKVEIAKLRNNFMNNAQCLLHGDLHSGSIFINNKGIKIIDPEFAFYGPMGYDIGNVIGNLFFPLYYYKNQYWLKNCIIEIFDKTFEKLSKVYDNLVTIPLYTEKEFKDYYIKKVISDTCAYAGTEIIRRVVGDTHVKEVDEAKDINIEKILIKDAIYLIMNRHRIRLGRDLWMKNYCPE